MESYISVSLQSTYLADLGTYVWCPGSLKVLSRLVPALVRLTRFIIFVGLLFGCEEAIQ